MRQHFPSIIQFQATPYSMSINWVMLHNHHEGFVLLPNERVIYTSPPRIGLSLQPFASSTGKDPFSIQSSAGCVYLTNQRVSRGLFPYSLFGWMLTCLVGGLSARPTDGQVPVILGSALEHLRLPHFRTDLRS